MKYTILFFTTVTLALASCNELGTKSDPSSTAQVSSDIPAGATLQPFDDIPELAAVTLNDLSGVSTQSGTVLDGKREGNWVEYHPSGLVKTITPYVNGKMEGLRLELNTNGQLKKQILYHNGMLHGEYKVFQYTTVKEERNYSNGKLEGIAKVYYDNGKIMEEGAYNDGIRDGVSKWYDQEGNVTIEYEYKNGQLVKK